jgi:MoxR-like ATPase
VRAAERPIVVITSNNEKELPDAFLAAASSTISSSPIGRRCRRSSTCISRHPEDARHAAMDIFYEVRDVPGLKKKPSTSELIDWLKLLLHEDMPLEVLQSATRATPSRPCTALCSRTSRM